MTLARLRPGRQRPITDPLVRFVVRVRRHWLTPGCSCDPVSEDLRLRRPCNASRNPGAQPVRRCTGLDVTTDHSASSMRAVRHHRWRWRSIAD
jgi:hypothetical protein